MNLTRMTKSSTVSWLNLHHAALWLIFFLAITSGPALRASSNSPSLLSNSDFQLATIDPAWPDDWAKAPGISWETDNGKHFLRLVAQKPNEHLMAYREMTVPSGVKGLEITIRYRTAGIVTGTQQWFDARAIFHFLDTTHKNVPPDPNVIIFSPTASSWTEASVRCAVPAGADKLALMPSLFMVTAGTLDLAEVRVTALSPSEAAALAPSAAVQKKTDQRTAGASETLKIKVSGSTLAKTNGTEVWL
jgi:hypothetical protein